MKRLLTLAALFLCCVATSFAQFSGSGSGTESDPYLVMNPIQLNQLRNFLGKSGVYFKLMADIDLTEFIQDEYPQQGWQPIGNSSSTFKGILDGNGKTVSGLWIKRGSTDYVGLFGSMYDGTVKNLTLKGSAVIGHDYVGFLAGEGGEFENCTIAGSVSGNSYVGGCVGRRGGFRRVTSLVDVTATGDYVGGISGDNVYIHDCTVKAAFVKGVNYVGGLCGSENVGNEFESSYVYTNVSGNDYVGGICGQRKMSNKYSKYNGGITKCGFVGDVTANAYVGGVCGEYTTYSATMNGCFAIGHVTGSGNYVGGIIGYSSVNSISKNNEANCYFSGSVAGKEQVGGLVGYKKYGSIQNCYAHATVTGSKSVGGLCGKIEGYSSYSYSDFLKLLSNVSIVTSVKATEGSVGRVYGEKGNVTIGKIGTSEENKAYNRAIVVSQGVAQDALDDEQHGTGVSASTLKLKATYVAMGWDFNDTWEIQETECYPYMKSQTAPPVIQSKVVSGATTVSGKCVDGGTVTLEIDGVKQQMVSKGHEFSFTISPLQAGHEVRVSAKADGKEQSYYTTEVVSYLGKGTESDPYQIFTAADLTNVYRYGYYKLMNDIDLTDYINQYSPTEGWESIGREGSETVYFDGNGHKITGLWCNSTRDNTGLFSCFANGYIKNLTVETAKGKQVKGGQCTGILIGKLINGELTDCQVNGTVAGSTYVGGMTGWLDGGKMTRCQASATLSATGSDSRVGGLAGKLTGSASLCQSNTQMTANGEKTYAGGLTGELTGEATQCLSSGTLTATGSGSYIGGLVGLNGSGSSITDSYSNAATHSSLCAAGLVGYSYGKIERCYAQGDIFSQNYGAGIVGYNDGAKATVKQCVAMSNKIDVRYESQQVQQSGGYGQRIVGGIRNGAPAPEMDNYALKTMQVSVNNVAQKVYDDIMNGTARTGAELMKQATYRELGWDFTKTWTLTEGETYPWLQQNVAVVGGATEEEPQVSTDDALMIADATASIGGTVSVGIGLVNKSANLTAYQFDLTLPAGITLAQNEKGRYIVTKTERYEDESQSLNVSAVEGTTNTYRVVSFSLSNGLIEGSSGAILNAELQVGKTVGDGSYEATIGNIIFTRADGTQLKLADAKFNVVVTSVVPGDANGDGDVNVSDIVEIVNSIMGKPSAKFVRGAADLNGDGEVNVTDIVMVVNIIMSAQNAGARSLGSKADKPTDGDLLTLAETSGQQLALSLENQGRYVASQFDVRLSEGQTLAGITMNSRRLGNHRLAYMQTDSNVYRVVVYSLGNESFAGESGELLDIEVAGSGTVGIENALFVTAGQQEKRFAPVYGSATTGIDNPQLTSDDSQAVYDLQGRRVANVGQKGIYIKNGKKQVVK